jgi:hypothetical protein
VEDNTEEEVSGGVGTYEKSTIFWSTPELNTDVPSCNTAKLITKEYQIG